MGFFHACGVSFETHSIRVAPLYSRFGASGKRRFGVILSVAHPRTIRLAVALRPPLSMTRMGGVERIYRNNGANAGNYITALPNSPVSFADSPLKEGAKMRETLPYSDDSCLHKKKPSGTHHAPRSVSLVTDHIFNVLRIQSLISSHSSRVKYTLSRANSCALANAPSSDASPVDAAHASCF